MKRRSRCAKVVSPPGNSQAVTNQNQAKNLPPSVANVNMVTKDINKEVRKRKMAEKSSKSKKSAKRAKATPSPINEDHETSFVEVATARKLLLSLTTLCQMQNL